MPRTKKSIKIKAPARIEWKLRYKIPEVKMPKLKIQSVKLKPIKKRK